MSTRGLNWPLWSGFLLGPVAFLSYPLVFERWPATRDFPWANLLLFGMAACLLAIGLRRVFSPGRLQWLRITSGLLPRIRPNLAIGIRTRLTLQDRALWMRVHRSAGYMTVACGAVIVLSAIAVPRPVGPGMILLVGPAAVVGARLLVWVSRQDVHA
jgi:uncharacterized membrane protein